MLVCNCGSLLTMSASTQRPACPVTFICIQSTRLLLLALSWCSYIPWCCWFLIGCTVLVVRKIDQQKFAKHKKLTTDPKVLLREDVKTLYQRKGPTCRYTVQENRQPPESLTQQNRTVDGHASLKQNHVCSLIWRHVIYPGHC